MEKVNPRTHCNHCRAELTKDEKRGCMICRVCHPAGDDKPLVPQIKPKLLDVKFTEEQIREIVRDELENWHIQKPPVTKAEAKETDEALRKIDWRAQAKELGIPLFQRKKADVLAEIAKKKAS